MKSKTIGHPLQGRCKPAPSFLGQRRCQRNLCLSLLTHSIPCCTVVQSEALLSTNCPMKLCGFQGCSLVRSGKGAAAGACADDRQQNRPRRSLPWSRGDWQNWLLWYVGRSTPLGGRPQLDPCRDCRWRMGHRVEGYLIEDTSLSNQRARSCLGARWIASGPGLSTLEACPTMENFKREQVVDDCVLPSRCTAEVES